MHNISKHSNYLDTEYLTNKPSYEAKDIFECQLLSIKPDHDYEVEKLW